MWFSFEPSILVMNIIYFLDVPFALILKLFNQLLNLLFIVFKTSLKWVLIVLKLLKFTLKSLTKHFLFLALKIDRLYFSQVFVLQYFFLRFHLIHFKLNLHIIPLIIINNPILLPNILFIFFVLFNTEFKGLSLFGKYNEELFELFVGFGFAFGGHLHLLIHHIMSFLQLNRYPGFLRILLLLWL